jgi:hypothetical protein
MVGTLTGAAAPRGLRSRRGAAIVAVTAASLGVGGLAAAGPGVFPRVLDFGRAALPDQVQPEIAADSARPPVVVLPEAVTSNPASPAAPGVVPGGAGAAQPALAPASPATPADPRPAGAEGSSDGADEAPASCVDDDADLDDADLDGADLDHADLVVEVAQTDERESVAEVARPDCGNAAEAGPPASTPGNDDPGAPVAADPPSEVGPAGGGGPSTGTKSPHVPEPAGPASPSTPPEPDPPAPTPPAPANPPAPTPGNPGPPIDPSATPPTPPTPPTPVTRPTPAAPLASPPSPPVVPQGPGDAEPSAGSRAPDGPPAQVDDAPGAGSATGRATP